MKNIVNTEHFGLQRKVVANMTTESWQSIPHVTYQYEPDCTEMIRTLKKINAMRAPEDKISVNTLMLKIIAEGLKAAPGMNASIQYNKALVRGKTDSFREINISVPMIMPTGEMMTVNVRGFDWMNLDDITDKMRDIRRKAENTVLDEALYEASLYNTFQELRQGKFLKSVGRLVGSKTGKYKLKLLKGEARERYYSIPTCDRLTGFDVEQGTITVSNIGSVYPGQRGGMALLEIIPPQVCAIGIAAAQDRPAVVTLPNGKKCIEARKIMPMCIAFDHRALDFGEIVPFMKKTDEIFAHPEVIYDWLNTPVKAMHCLKNA